MIRKELLVSALCAVAMTSQVTLTTKVLPGTPEAELALQGQLIPGSPTGGNLDNTGMVNGCANGAVCTRPATMHKPRFGRHYEADGRYIGSRGRGVMLKPIMLRNGLGEEATLR